MGHNVVPLADRKLVAVVAYVPLRLRTDVERLAHRQRVSMAEIARRAVQQYVTKAIGRGHNTTREET